MNLEFLNKKVCQTLPYSEVFYIYRHMNKGILHCLTLDEIRDYLNIGQPCYTYLITLTFSFMKNLL